MINFARLLENVESLYLLFISLLSWRKTEIYSREKCFFLIGSIHLLVCQKSVTDKMKHSSNFFQMNGSLFNN